ncbi:MAG: TraR/DksA family transcriptional regulator [Patescibacteria group bacterium]
MAAPSNLDKEFIKKIEDQLLAEKERLEKELSQFTKKNPHNASDYDANFPTIGDAEDENAAEVATYSDNLTLERTLESALRDVNGALKRIKEGTYGICKYCGQVIDPKRLEARPSSSACMECKSKFSK